MSTVSLPKFCPVCKLSNEANAFVCEYCGAVLIGSHQADNETTKNMTNRRATDLLNLNNQLKLPDEGIAFFLFGKNQPFAVKNEDIIYLGRVEKETLEIFVDLSLVDGFNLGVSRRHAMIQREDGRVEIMDLHSNNGTFLNGNRLEPLKPYELKSGATLQLGRLKLIAIYSWSQNR